MTPITSSEGSQRKRFAERGTYERQERHSLAGRSCRIHEKTYGAFLSDVITP
jgi:hypothetical protein